MRKPTLKCHRSSHGLCEIDRAFGEHHRGLSTQTFVTKQNTMQRAEPIPEPIDPYLSDNDDPRSKTTRKKFDRDPVANWMRVMTFLNEHTLEPNQNFLHPSSRYEPSVRGVGEADFSIAVVGNGGIEESSLRNRTLARPDITFPLGIFKECTVTTNVSCPRVKVINDPDLQAWDVSKAPLLKADVVLLAFDELLRCDVSLIQSLCARHGSLLVLVRTGAYSSIKARMRQGLPRHVAFSALKKDTQAMLKKEGVDIPCFHIDNDKWEDTLFEYHDGKARTKARRSRLMYDEGKLMRFVARAAFSRYPSKGPAARTLRKLVR